MHHFVYRLNDFGIPFFLQGDIKEDDDNDNDGVGCWEIFIQQTLGRIKAFTNFLKITFIPIYILSTIIIAIPENKIVSHLRSALQLLLIWTSVIAFVAYNQMHHLSQYTWAESIRSGTLFAKPFPYIHHDNKRMMAMMENNHYEFTRAIRVPGKNQVLIGSRFDSRYIGLYNQFLDFHPGNYQWHKLLHQNAWLFHSYDGIMAPAVQLFSPKHHWSAAASKVIVFETRWVYW